MDTALGEAASEAAAPSSDESLMQQYQSGSVAAFEQLYQRHKDRLYRFCLRGLNNNRDAAQEIAQDVWTQCIRNRARWAPTARFSTWLYTLAHHRLIDHHRARWHEALPADASETLASPEVGPERATASQETGQRILAGLQKLPFEQREAVLLQLEGGLSLEEIASAQGVGRETVKSRLRYALAKLRQELCDDRP